MHGACIWGNTDMSFSGTLVPFDDGGGMNVLGLKWI